MKILPYLILLLWPLLLASQSENPYTPYFEEAYQSHPAIPRGVLEAVSWHYTHMHHLDGTEAESCLGLPRYYSVMGLVEDGKGYFRHSLQVVSSFSGYDAASIKNDPRTAILAYAAALEWEMTYSSAIWLGLSPPKFSISDTLFLTLKSIIALSEIADPYQYQNDEWEIMTLNHLAEKQLEFGVLNFLCDSSNRQLYGIPDHQINLKNYFTGGWRIILGKKIFVNPAENKIYDENMVEVRVENDVPPQFKSQDYSPAIWTPAPNCNYGSRNGTAVSAVTVHTVQGSYSGCISWFQNCNAQVSAHYVVRSSDGQVTQMVLESQRAYHVGSENPYTIGIEHEGYVDNPSWYTTAMYNASSALVIDITNSGYGINPLRTAWWPWTASTYYNQSGIPGSCSKIKGHQHYPNQTHTDPGPNWDWNRYYKLINPSPNITLLTAPTGILLDPGGNGVYANDQREVWTISPPNAASVTLNFTGFELENQWDYLYIYDGPDINSPLIGYYTGTNSPGTITSTQGHITMEFRSDCATTLNGWSLNWNSSLINPQIPDNVPPVTSINTGSNWKTQNFTAQFSEADDTAGTGIEKSYYQVIDYDGFEWRGNAEAGFFSDNFDIGLIHPEWTVYTGVWNANANILEQTDESNGNTNISAYLNQNLADRYLYHFAMSINGTGNNRRAGLHFFADSASLPNRGNGYFVWFRVDNAKLQFYKVTNDVFNLESEVAMTINPGQWYDYKVIYDRTTGKVSVYQDNVLAGSWADASPYTNGKYVSFRSGNASAQVNDFRVYKSRNTNTAVNVTVGTCNSCEIRYQNPSPSIAAGQIRSIVADSAGNLSAIAFQYVDADWTPPSTPALVGDSMSNDIDTTYDLNLVSGNWQFSVDTNSGIARYYYAFGSSPGDSNIIPWTDNWFMTSFMDTLAVLPGTYYVSVRAENNAGLISGDQSSDGIVYFVSTGIKENDPLFMRIFPNPVGNVLQVQWSQSWEGDFTLDITNSLGEIILQKQGSAGTGYNYVSADLASLSLAPAAYFVRLHSGTYHQTTQIIISH